MKIGSIFIIIVLSLLPTKVVCSDENKTNYDSLISLKNNEEIKVRIIAFHLWGLSIQEGLTVNYQVIESITTTDSSVIDSLKTYITDLKIEKYKDQFILSFEDSELPLLPIKNFKFLNQSSLILNIPDIGSNNIEFQFNFIPKFNKKLIGQIAYSLGSYNSDNIYQIIEYSIGIGTVFNISTGDLHLLFNYSRTHRDTISRGSDWYPKGYHMNTLSQNRLFVTLYYKKRFFADQLVATLGIRYNYSDVSIKKSNSKLGINIGIGRTFN